MSDHWRQWVWLVAGWLVTAPNHPTLTTNQPSNPHPRDPPHPVVICPDKCLPSDNKEKTHLHYTHLVDAWAVGVLAYELTVGRAPFDAGNKRATIEQILNGTPTFPSWLSEQAHHFISWSLTKDLGTRPDVHQLAYHPWVTGHSVTKPRRSVAPGRAASVTELRMLPQVATEEHVHMEARHKALATGQIGGPAEMGGCADAFESSYDEGEEEEEEANEWSAGAAMSAAASVPVSHRPAAAAAASPFAEQSAAAPEPPQQQQSGGTRGVMESAADNLRAYVVRCQSANNLESLRAAVLMQPPEPSNACFEPGGRFYSPKASLLQQQAARGAAAAAAAAAAGSSASAGDHHQQQQQGVMALHDSVTSVASDGSPKPAAPASRSAPLPPITPSRPPAVRMPGMASAGKAPVSPARSTSPMPITPEGGAVPRIALFSSKAPPASSPSAASAATPCSRSSGHSMGTDSMQVDGSSGSGNSNSGYSSCGSPTDFGLMCRTASGAALVPPQPVSPIMGSKAAGHKTEAAGGGGRVAQGGWFALQCVNFLKSASK